MRTKINVLQFLFESTGVFRNPLRTTVISLMDLIANRSLYRFVPLLSRLVNRFLGGNFGFRPSPTYSTFGPTEWISSSSRSLQRVPRRYTSLSYRTSIPDPKLDYQKV